MLSACRSTHRLLLSLFGPTNDSFGYRIHSPLLWSVIVFLVSANLRSFLCFPFSSGLFFSGFSLCFYSITSKRRRRCWRWLFALRWWRIHTRWRHFCDIFIKFGVLFPLKSEFHHFYVCHLPFNDMALRSSHVQGLSQFQSLVFSATVNRGSLSKSGILRSPSSPSLQSSCPSSPSFVPP